MSIQTSGRHRGRTHRRWLRPLRREPIHTASLLETANYLRGRLTERDARDAADIPALELPQGDFMRHRPRTTPGTPYAEQLLTPTAPVRVLAVDGARIGYYQPSHSVKPLRVGDNVYVTVADTDDPDREQRAVVAAFRTDPASPVGLALAADDDPTFIVWYPADAVRLATSPVEATLLMDALADFEFMGGTR